MVGLASQSQAFLRVWMPITAAKEKSPGKKVLPTGPRPARFSQARGGPVHFTQHPLWMWQQRILVKLSVFPERRLSKAHQVPAFLPLEHWCEWSGAPISQGRLHLPWLAIQLFPIYHHHPLPALRGAACLLSRLSWRTETRRDQERSILLCSPPLSLAWVWKVRRCIHHH